MTLGQIVALVMMNKCVKYRYKDSSFNSMEVMGKIIFKSVKGHNFVKKYRVMALGPTVALVMVNK